MTLPPHDPTAQDDQNVKLQRQMAYFLPLISILWGSTLPAGLFLYWITATLIQIGQQYLILGWGGMFPLFGWYPEFARNHSPRFPVKIPSPSRPRPASPQAQRSARRPSIGTCPPARRSGPTEPEPRDEGDDADMSEYQEFTGKSVEEAIKTACDAFGVGLADLDFEILTPGSRGVLGMGAEPARIVAAPRSALGGAAPKREAAEATPAPRAGAARGPAVRSRPRRPTGAPRPRASPGRPRRLPRRPWPRPRPGSRAPPGRPRTRRAPAPRAATTAVGYRSERGARPRPAP